MLANLARSWAVLPRTGPTATRNAISEWQHACGRGFALQVAVIVSGEDCVGNPAAGGTGGPEQDTPAMSDRP